MTRQPPADTGAAPDLSATGGAGRCELTWFEVADALWLAARTSSLAGDPEPAGPGSGTTDDRAQSGTGEPDRPVEAGEARPDPAAGRAADPSPPPPRPPAVAEQTGSTRDTRTGHADPARSLTARSVDGGGDLLPGRTDPLLGRTDPLLGRPDPLPAAGAIRRALRPLRQLVPSHARVLDEQATAERAADDPLWLPVLQPAPEPRWDLVVVVDTHISMAVWQDTVSAFTSLLRQQGAFRDVVIRWLDTDAKRPADLRLRGTRGRGVPMGPAELLTSTGRRLVLVLTDGAAPAWHTDAMQPLLHTWAQRLPVALVHLLPPSQWHRTGVRPHRLRLRAPGSGTANRRLSWQHRDPEPETLDPDSPVDEQAVPLPVPVLSLEPRWLRAWTRLVASDRSRWISLPGVLARPWREATGAGSSPPAGPAQEPWQRVVAFTSWATPTALNLATHLAAAPLNLPVMQLVQRTLLPNSDNSHLAEVLSSGLLRPVVPTTEVAVADRVTFEFDRGVREELLAVGRRADATRVLQVVDQYLGPSVPVVRGLTRMLDDPDTGPERPVTPQTEPFVKVERAVLRALSGRYLARARRLGSGVDPDHVDAGADDGSAGIHVATSVNEAEPVTMTTPAAAGTPHRPLLGGAGVSSRTVEEKAPRSAVPPPSITRTPTVWGNVPPRNPNFTGRVELLAQLHERMQAGTTAVLPQALHGMGGVGKSQLAVEYVYRHQDEYDLIWWIPAERPAQVGAALAELAQRMELPVGPEVSVAVPAVREALRLGQPYANWLLVFDNAESPEAVRSFLPTGGPGSIMVTSRNPQWASIAQPLEVDVLTRQESMQLLRRRGPELEDGAADQLAEALGDLPLALESAAAWRAETGMSADEYLRLFEEKRAEVLQVSAPVDYQLPVAAAWNVSLDRLQVSNPAALRLLQVCSFFAPEPISRTMLNSARSADIDPELNAALRDPMKLNRAIRDINRYALARIDHRINSIQMHRLVQAVLVDRMSEAERAAMRHSAHLLLASSDRNEPTAPSNWRTYSVLYPHLVVSDAYRSTDPWVQQLVDNEAMYLYWWGDHQTALELSRQTYGWRREQVGEHALTTLSIGRWLGFMLFVVGRYQEASEFNTRLLRAHEQVAGGEDTDELLAAIGAVAADRRVAGDFAGALEIDEDLYERHVRSLGDSEPATLNAAHNLAVSVRLTGDLVRARDLDYDTYTRRVALFGEEHAITLESTRNLVIDRRELGDYVTARAHQQEIVDRLRQVVSTEHPQLLRAQRSLSTAMRKAGDHHAARQLSEQVRNGFVARYGEDHPDTITATLNFAIDLRACGELDLAIEHGEQVRSRYEQRIGPEHPHTVAAAANLATTYRLRGDPARARQLDEEAYALLSDKLGPDHPLTLTCRVNLASDLYAQGDYAAAHEHDAAAVQQLRQVFGEDHPTTLACLGNLAMDLVGLGRHDEAHTLHADTMTRFRTILGEQHPATIAAADLTLRADCDLDPMPL